MASTHDRATAPTKPSRLLIAGVGNVLRQDDGFGIEVAQRLLKRGGLPEGVRVVETGIGGIHLVQDLMETRYDALLMLDAVDRGGEPGQLYLLHIDVSDIRTLEMDEQREFLADMHYTNPMRALMLARALEVIPPHVYMLGCEAAHHDFALGLSSAVEQALPAAIDQVDAWVAQFRSVTPIA